MFPSDLTLEQLRSYQPILVAVSGGADSIALLAFLAENQLKVIAASFDHQLRPDSAEDVTFVSVYCVEKGIQFVSGLGDVSAYVLEHKASVEEAARHLRYTFLFTTALKFGCKAVAVGHTQDDQAETVLMRFIRGAGLAGLKGMRPITRLERYSATLPLLRPILGWRRSETEAFCRERGIQPRMDSTNQDPSYPRNRIRAELIPILQEYNPSITETLARNAGILSQQNQVYEDVVSSAFNDSLIQQGTGWLLFSVKKLEGFASILKQEIIRRAVFTLKPGIRDVDAETFDRFSLTKPTDLGGGFKTLIEGDHLYVSDDENLLPNQDYPQISDPITLTEGRTTLSNGWVISMEIRTPRSDNFIPTTDTEIWLDVDIPCDELYLRVSKPGDRIKLFRATTGSVKCSDLFINEKVPSRYRSNYPLLIVNGEVLWVPLLRRSSARIIQKNTRLAARIVIQKSDS